jgi:hypothetical protein
MATHIEEANKGRSNDVAT